MVHLTNLAHQMDEMKDYSKLTALLTVAHLAWLTPKDLKRVAYLAGRMTVMKDALMNLDFHLAVM